MCRDGAKGSGEQPAYCRQAGGRPCAAGGRWQPEEQPAITCIEGNEGDQEPPHSCKLGEVVGILTGAHLRSAGGASGPAGRGVNGTALRRGCSGRNGHSAARRPGTRSQAPHPAGYEPEEHGQGEEQGGGGHVGAEGGRPQQEGLRGEAQGTARTSSRAGRCRRGCGSWQRRGTCTPARPRTRMPHRDSICGRGRGPGAALVAGAGRSGGTLVSPAERRSGTRTACLSVPSAWRGVGRARTLWRTSASRRWPRSSRRRRSCGGAGAAEDAGWAEWQREGAPRRSNGGVPACTRPHSAPGLPAESHGAKSVLPWVLEQAGAELGKAAEEEAEPQRNLQF